MIDQRLSREIAALFFLSGAAALIYQVAWQRALFTYIGVDVISVAVIVSMFMLGLGFGGLIGGYVADRGKSLVGWFSGVELLIAIYGLISLHLIRKMAEIFPALNVVKSAVLALAILLPPTLLMGATLPLLVIQANREWGNIGKSTGYLYLANSLGAAMGALSCGFIFFHVMTLNQGVLVAAAINAFVSVKALVLHRRITS